MKEVMLYTRDGGYVTTVIVPPFQLMPEIINWGQRFFTRNTDEKYLEGFCVTAFTKEQLKGMLS